MRRSKSVLADHMLINQLACCRVGRATPIVLIQQSEWARGPADVPQGDGAVHARRRQQVVRNGRPGQRQDGPGMEPEDVSGGA